MADAGKGKRPAKVDRDAPRPSPSEVAFQGRTVHTNDVFASPETDFEAAPYDHKLGVQLSSYPHLTREDSMTHRPAHVTDVRFVGTVRHEDTEFSIHERFHQDDHPDAPRVHDRFLATAPDGTVHSATAHFLPDVHYPKHAAKPMRGDLVDDPRREKVPLGFSVGAPDEKHPPLSPRTRKRL